MQHLDDVGEDYSKGNYVSGTALLVFITPFTLIADIFTFGGSMDAQQSSAVWTGAASEYAQNEAAQQQRDAERQQRVIEQQLRASALAEQQAQAEQMQRAEARQQQSYENNRPSVQLASYDAQEGAGQAKAVNSCVAIQPNPNIREARHMVNTCAFPIRVTYCTEGVVTSGGNKGRRVDECARGQWSGKSLAAGGRDLHNYNHVGVTTVFIACPEPFYAPGSKLSYANGVAQGRCQK